MSVVARPRRSLGVLVLHGPDQSSAVSDEDCPMVIGLPQHPPCKFSRCELVAKVRCPHDGFGTPVIINVKTEATHICLWDSQIADASLA
jgi:hypothetical protein